MQNKKSPAGAFFLTEHKDTKTLRLFIFFLSTLFSLCLCVFVFN